MRAAWDLRGPLYYGWVIPGAAAVLLIGCTYARFLKHLPARTRRTMFWAAAVFLGGSLGVEMVSAWWADVHGEANLTYALIITAEEFGEMLGVVILVEAGWVFLDPAMEAPWLHRTVVLFAVFCLRGGFYGSKLARRQLPEAPWPECLQTMSKATLLAAGRILE